MTHSYVYCQATSCHVRHDLSFHFPYNYDQIVQAFPGHNLVMYSKIPANF